MDDGTTTWAWRNGEADPLAGLRTGRPRLLATADDWRKVVERRAREPDVDALAAEVVRQARLAAALPPVERIQIGRRLLSVSREALRRILLHTAAFRLEGDPAFAEAARREMLAAAAFSDWNPSHFLDVAEMTAALAIGLDGLFDVLDGETRREVREAILRHGLRPAIEGEPRPLFYEARNNWNQVCLGGLALGALAVAEDAPETARAILAAARTYIGNGLSAYAPDGIYPEGPTYWGYGTAYQVLLIEALRSALGRDGGMAQAPGFLESAAFVRQMLGPTGLYFNFADSGAAPGLDPTLLWFARELGAPDMGAAQAEATRRAVDDGAAGLGRARFLPLALLWWPPPGAASDPLPRHWHGRGHNPVAAWRTAWDDPAAVFFAIKGGGAAVNHGHMDAGAFVFDAGGVRWAFDPGMQDYESLERVGVRLWGREQDAERWQVFRLGSHAHNTLTIDNALHGAEGLATFIRAGADGAEIDLSPVFRGQARRVTRRIDWRGSDGVAIEDRIEGARPGTDIRWAMITAATAEIDGATVRLTQGDRRLTLAFEAVPARVEAVSIEEPGGYNVPNPDRRRIELHTEADADGCARVRATLRP